MRKDYEDKIIEVEIIAGKTATPVNEIWMRLYRETGDEVYLELARRLERGEAKWRVYARYLSDEVLYVFKTVEEKGIPIHEVLEKVKEVRGEVKGLISSIRGKTFLPVFYYVIATAILYFVINQFLNVFNQLGSSIPKEYAESLKSLGVVPPVYLVVNTLIFLLLLFGLVLYPHRFPLVREIFRKVEGLRVLAFTLVFYASSIPLEGIIKFFRNLGGFYEKAFNVKDYTEEEFAKALKNFLEPEEAVILEISAKTGMFTKNLEELYREKLKNVRKLSERVSTLFFILTFLFLAIPFSFFFVVYYKGMMSVVKGVMELMNQF